MASQLNHRERMGLDLDLVGLVKIVENNSEGLSHREEMIIGGAMNASLSGVFYGVSPLLSHFFRPPYQD